MIRLIFTLFLTLLLFNTTQAQEDNLSWTAPGNNWFYQLTPIRDQTFEYLKLFVDRDTLIGDRKCAILVPDTLAMYYPEIITYADPDDEGKILYRFVDTGFIKLYDFTLSVGDLYDVPIPDSDYPPFSGNVLTLRVDSVWTTYLNGREVIGQRTVIVDDVGDQSFDFEGTAYQYSGMVTGYFVPFPALSCEGACPYEQHCFSNLDEGVEVQLTDVSCDGISSNSYLSDVSHQTQLFPNPLGSSESLTFRLSPELAAGPAAVRIFDRLGRVVLQRDVAVGQTNIEFRLPGLAGGFYFLEWRTGTARAVRRFVVE